MPSDSHTVPQWFTRLARYGWGFIGIVGGSALVVLGLAALRELVIPLVLATVFAIVFNPPVEKLAGWGVPRAIGAVIMILVTTVLVWGALAIVIVGVVDQGDELTQRFDEATVEIQDLIDQSDFESVVEQLRESADESGPTLRDGLASQVGTFLDSAAGAASGLVLGVVLLYYLLKDGPTITNWLATGRTEESTATNRRIFDQAGSSIRSYFRGRTALAIAQGLFIGVAMALMGVPLAGSIGIVNMIASYIPFLGAFIGGAFAVLMALSEGGIALAVAALLVAVFMNVVLENVLEPRFVGSSLDLHPIVVLVATVAGGAIAGILGLVLAAPLTSIGINLFHELQGSGFFEERPQGRGNSPPADSDSS